MIWYEVTVIILKLMEEQKISRTTRLLSMLLDHMFMLGIAMILGIPQLLLNLIQNQDSALILENFDIFPGHNYLGLIGFALYFCKDSINGRSIAKRIFKLQVVDNLTGNPASPFQCLIRNVFCIIWPIEVIVSLNTTDRRIGDRIARTKLVPFNMEQEQTAPHYIQIVVVLIITYIVMNLIWSKYSSFNGFLHNRVNSSGNLYYQ